MSIAHFPDLKSQKVLFGCADCGSRSFKFMTYGQSEEVVTRCANCEAIQPGVSVRFDDV